MKLHSPLTHHILKKKKQAVTCSKPSRHQSLPLEPSGHLEKPQVSQPVSICPLRLRKHFYQPKQNLSLTGRKIVPDQIRCFSERTTVCCWCTQLPHPGIQNGIPSLGQGHWKKEPATGFDSEKLSKQ